ncbi:MAG: peptidoglycan-binding protein [Bacilli bacterium]|nr:peptidoglycan-binding protein [Bacilli bacterium]MBR2711510.1 peptidoglycan-binding protein [Bacilli bacterium]
MLTISQRQLALRTYGYYYKGEIDGIEGPQTKEAYANFQSDFGLVVDSIYGENTEFALRCAIRILQYKLWQRGYDLVLDGIVGNATLGAIEDYQSKNGLVVDSIVGPATFEKLGGRNLKWEELPHFQPWEMECPCCGMNNTNMAIMAVLEYIRSHYGDSPLIITSGDRCNNYNAKVGGIAGSMHTKGGAADFYVLGVLVGNLLSFCEELVRQGVISYTYTNNTNMNGVVHINL